MRRFSERSHLVTLSEINITPLLDLAFVLLIIFVITTPLLEQSINLKLPHGGQTNQKVDKNNIRTVEVTSTGYYLLEKQHLRKDQVQARLVKEAHENPNLIVYLRADRTTPYDLLAGIFDVCQRNGITISMATDPRPDR